MGTSGSLANAGPLCAALYVTEVDGRLVRRRVYGKTRAEVETKLVELRTEVVTGAPLTPSQPTGKAYLEEWLSHIVAARVRANTLADGCASSHG